MGAGRRRGGMADGQAALAACPRGRRCGCRIPVPGARCGPGDRAEGAPPQGIVVDLGFYQAGAERVRLGEELHHNGLSILCAQIGRVPRGMAATWPRSALAVVTLDLLQQRGDDVRTHLITDVLPFEEGPRLLTALAGRRLPSPPLQAVLRMPPA